MRPLFHPPLEDVSVEGILHALSDPVRLALFSQIAGTDCEQTCSRMLEMSQRTIPKSTLSNHFTVLREAGLIRSERHGVEMRNRSRCVEIHQRFPGLLAAIVDAYTRQSKPSPRGGDPVGKRKAGGKR